MGLFSSEANVDTTATATMEQVAITGSVSARSPVDILAQMDAAIEGGAFRTDAKACIEANSCTEIQTHGVMTNVTAKESGGVNINAGFITSFSVIGFILILVTIIVITMCRLRNRQPLNRNEVELPAWFRNENPAEQERAAQKSNYQKKMKTLGITIGALFILVLIGVAMAIYFATSGTTQGSCVNVQPDDYCKKYEHLCEREPIMISRCGKTCNTCGFEGRKKALNLAISKGNLQCEDRVEVKKPGFCKAKREFCWKNYDFVASCAQICGYCEFNAEKAAQIKAEQYKELISVFKGEGPMKAEIDARGPLACGIAVPDALEYYSSGIFCDDTGDVNIVHGVSVVGYGIDADTKQAYWLVRNSWGTNWGENGFFRVCRGKNNIAIESDCAMATPKDTWTTDERHLTTQAEKDSPLNDKTVYAFPQPTYDGETDKVVEPAKALKKKQKQEAAELKYQKEQEVLELKRIDDEADALAKAEQERLIAEGKETEQGLKIIEKSQN